MSRISTTKMTLDLPLPRLGWLDNDWGLAAFAGSVPFGSALVVWAFLPRLRRTGLAIAIAGYLLLSVFWISAMLPTMNRSSSGLDFGEGRDAG